MRKKCESWPVVLVNDDGIRPAGLPDECFYCHQKVGQPHTFECVTVTCINCYGVYMEDANSVEISNDPTFTVKVGTYTRHDPVSWDDHDCNFHKNEGSWCADNAFDGIEWNNLIAKNNIDSLIEKGDLCSCQLLQFRFETMIDAGPYIEVDESNN